MSQCAACGRGTPRWSVAEQVASFPPSIAGLPARSAIVWFGPPLFCKGPSSGSVLFTLEPLKGQVPSLLRFPPPSTTVDMGANAVLVGVIVGTIGVRVRERVGVAVKIGVTGGKGVMDGVTVGVTGGVTVGVGV